MWFVFYNNYEENDYWLFDAVFADLKSAIRYANKEDEYCQNLGTVYQFAICQFDNEEIYYV